MAKYLIDGDERYPDYSIVAVDEETADWELEYAVEFTDEEAEFIRNAARMYNMAQEIIKGKKERT